MQEIKIIFEFLKGMLDFGLWYPRGKYFTLVTYIDANWLCSVDDKKSTSGCALLLGSILVSWLSKKQAFIFFINNRDRIHKINVMLHTSSSDEAKH